MSVVQGDATVDIRKAVVVFERPLEKLLMKYRRTPEILSLIGNSPSDTALQTPASLTSYQALYKHLSSKLALPLCFDLASSRFLRHGKGMLQKSYLAIRKEEGERGHDDEALCLLPAGNDDAVRMFMSFSLFYNAILILLFI